MDGRTFQVRLANRAGNEARSRLCKLPLSEIPTRCVPDEGSWDSSCCGPCPGNALTRVLWEAVSALAEGVDILERAVGDGVV